MASGRNRHVSSLRTQILRLRLPIHGTDRYFIPQNALIELMTKDTVHQAISACADIEIYQVAELVDIIINGAIKVFAILILLKGEEGLILRFVENDGLQKTTLDARLPLHRSHIESLVPEDAVDDFYEKQWEFVAPFFSKAIIHRVMPPPTRLPFVLDTDTSKEGGFGHIYEIQLHPEYHEYPHAPNSKGHRRLVRKEFHPNSSELGTFKQEMENLNILNQIKHPNIVEGLGSYTYRGKHNLIFPMATGGDLADLLTAPSPPSEFADDVDIYKALSDLASAIHVIHRYTATSIDLNLIGVHHDLKPQNILVHEGAFIIADFGLAKFSSADQTSKSLFKIGAGHYLAPECEDYDDAFRKCSVSRPSDIWSFGCILAEIATYMISGPDGVAKFKAARKVKIAGFTTYTFHAGCNNPNPAVLEWFETHGEKTLMTPLLKEMLSMDPVLRPDALEVTVALLLLTINAYRLHIKAQLVTISTKFSSHDLEAQQQLFDAWCDTVWSTCEAGDDPWSSEDSSASADAGPKSTVECLEEIRREVRYIAFRYAKATSPLFHNLRRLNEKLIDLLHTELRRQIHSRFQLWAVQQDRLNLDTVLQDPYGEHSSHSRKLTMLATMQRMSLVKPSNELDGTSQYNLGPDSVKILKRLEDHLLGSFQPTSSSPARHVLIEQVRYDTHWEGAVSKEMFARMAAIAELLRSLSAPDQLPILPCLGFYHMPSRFSFGFVFECPPANLDIGSSPLPPRPSSLAEILDDTQFARNRPSLNDRFRLAQLLATTLLDFHKAGWLHKSMSSYNVISFRIPGSSAADWLKRPFLIGFNRSRQDQATAFTEGPDPTEKSLQYLHPRYIKTNCRYRRSFDYYSLGLVLLEIGLWQTLASILINLDVHPPKMSANVLNQLLVERVPLLSHAMGDDYCRAVYECLQWDTAVDDAEMSKYERISLLLKFQTLIVDPIFRGFKFETEAEYIPLQPQTQLSQQTERLTDHTATSAATLQASKHHEEVTQTPISFSDFDTLKPQKEQNDPDPATPRPNTMKTGSGFHQLGSEHLGDETPKPSTANTGAGFHPLESEPIGDETPRPSQRSFLATGSTGKSQPTNPRLDPCKPLTTRVDETVVEEIMTYRMKHHLGPPSFDNPLYINAKVLADRPDSPEFKAKRKQRQKPWRDVSEEPEDIDRTNPLGLQIPVPVPDTEADYPLTFESYALKEGDYRMSERRANESWKGRDEGAKG